MVAQFPASSSDSNSTNIDALLVPKLDILVNIRDVGTSEAAPLKPGQQIGDSINRYSRVVELQVKAKGIQIALIEAALKRIFAYATNAIVNDMNVIPLPHVDLPLTPHAVPTDNPKINVVIDVDRSNRDKTVDLQLVILNLKADSITATFDRLTTYIKESITTDLNPSV